MFDKPTPKADPNCTCICHTEPGVMHMMACCHAPRDVSLGGTLIPDADIERVHAHANFGDQAKRHVVDENLRKVKNKFHIGSTARSILLEHKLVYVSRKTRKLLLTSHGHAYLKLISTP